MLYFKDRRTWLCELEQKALVAAPPCRRSQKTLQHRMT